MFACTANNVCHKAHAEQLSLECGNVSLRTFFLKKERLETELNIHMKLKGS